MIKQTTLAITLLAGLSMSAFAQTLEFAMVDTMQENCYDASELIADPSPGDAFDGQDAQYIGTEADYTQSGDGLTVYDNNTRLTWTRSSDADGDGDIDANDKLTYTELFEMADLMNTVGYGGFSDWRVPSIKEIYSLMDFRGVDPSGYEGTDTSGLVPFIDDGTFEFAYGDTSAGERIIDSQYGSTSLYVDGEQLLFGVNFADGRIKGYGLTLLGRAKTFCALFCRGNEAYGINDFERMDTDIVVDNATGLMWQQADSVDGLNWEEALAYAEGLELGGYSDWRLPNAKELQAIVDYTRSPGTTGSAAIDPLFSCTPIVNEAGQTDFAQYWTGTTHENWKNAEWAVYIAFGRAMGYDSMAGWTDVHGAGCQRSDPKVGNLSGYTYADGGYYNSMAPQGDNIRIYNHVRCVREGSAMSLIPSGRIHSAAAASGQTLQVVPETVSSWTVTASETWITITSGSSGTGSGTVTYNVAANAGKARSGTLTVSGGSLATYTVNQWPAATHPLVAAEGDFDGDFEADLATFQPTTGIWNLLFSDNTQWTVPFGSKTMLPVPADYDGDGLSDIALFQRTTGDWYLLYSSGGSRKIRFGWSKTVPVPGDYDGDGRTDLALYYPNQVRWYFLCTRAGGYSAQFGGKSDLPIPADYDGDGATDLGVYRPSSGMWYIIYSGGGYRVQQLGWTGTIPVPGDYDGDGKADIAVLSRNSSKWCITYSGGGSLILAFGYKTMTPVQADYDGDGATDIAMYHPTSGTWYIRESSTGTHRKVVYGGSDRIPVLLYPTIYSWYDLL